MRPKTTVKNSKSFKIQAFTDLQHHPHLTNKLYTLVSSCFHFLPAVVLCIPLTVCAFFRISSLRRVLECFRQNHPSTTVEFSRSIKLTSSPEVALSRRSHHCIKRPWNLHAAYKIILLSYLLFTILKENRSLN